MPLPLFFGENLTVETKDYGKLTMDVAWGGNLYAIMPAESIGITIDPKNTAEIIHAAQSIACDINRQVDFHHPDLPFVYEVTHVEFYGPPKKSESRYSEYCCRSA